MMAARKGPQEPTSLYRFFDSGGALLYVGITDHLPGRVREHSKAAPWFRQAATVKVEHFPSRPKAAAAEVRAIKGEGPIYNVVHNSGGRTPSSDSARGRWVFRAHRSDHMKRADLWLYPELDCSSVVDEYFEYDGRVQFNAYVDYIQRRYPEWLAADAVPISWFVAGNGVLEAAPFARDLTGQDFLTHFTWPRDDAGEVIDWYSMPVVNDRFPEFVSALAWTPSPLQPTCPLSSILAARWGER